MQLCLNEYKLYLITKISVRKRHREVGCSGGVECSGVERRLSRRRPTIYGRVVRVRVFRVTRVRMFKRGRG